MTRYLAVFLLAIGLLFGPSAVAQVPPRGVQVVGDALTALQLSDNVIYVDDADWTDSTSSHALVGGLYQATPQTITDGDTGPLQLDSTGKILLGSEFADDAAFTLTGSFRRHELSF